LAHCSNCARWQPPDSQRNWIRVGGNVTGDDLDDEKLVGFLKDLSRFFSSPSESVRLTPASELQFLKIIGSRVPPRDSPAINREMCRSAVAINNGWVDYRSLFRIAFLFACFRRLSRQIYKEMYHNL
jgi:hypothetical protein